MSLKQLTIFVENKKGALVNITKTLADNSVNMRALSIADTQDFGILRLIVNDNDTATKALSVNVTQKKLRSGFLELMYFEIISVPPVDECVLKQIP